MDEWGSRFGVGFGKEEEEREKGKQ